METKLLCCPLCDQETPYPPTTSGPGMWVIMCSHCFLRVSDNTKAKVILKWNTRAPSPYKALCDELAEVMKLVKNNGSQLYERKFGRFTELGLRVNEALAKYESMKGEEKL